MTKQLLVLIDIQKEYTSEGRPFHIKSIGPSLRNAQRVLQQARDGDWPIIHVRHLQDGKSFNVSSEFSHFVDGFSPLEGEVVATKNNVSSYSSPEFAKFAEAHSAYQFVIVGYGSTMCCIGTIVEGYHRGHRFTFIQDASAARAADGLSEESMHSHVSTIIKTFATVMDTVDMIKDVEKSEAEPVTT